MQCLFCMKLNEDLIDMGINSISMNDDIIEFNELIRNLFNSKLPQDRPSFVCEECKNLLVQFHIFKQNVKSNSILLENENLKKVLMFLEENEYEEITCLRYNKCLTLVPSSKRSFMETFKNWQPHVVLPLVEEMQPPQKRSKLEEPPMKNESQIIQTVLESIKEDEELIEESIDIEEVDNREDFSEEEWLEAEVRNSEIIQEDNVVQSWACSHCEPVQKFYELGDFREHVLSMHMNYEVFEETVDEEIEKSMQDEKIDDINEGDSEKAQVVDLYNCTHCTYITENKNMFRIHLKLHVDPKTLQSTRFERFCCADCCYQFTAQSHYQAHVNGHQLFEIVAKHSNYPICTSCNAMFCDDSFLELHIKDHDVDREAEEIPAEGFFLKFGHYRPDMKVTEESIEECVMKCGHCLRRFVDEESCRVHQLIFHTTILKCPIENRVFNGNQAFSIHLKNNHPELFSDDIKFLCSVCKMEFDTLYNKLRHMKNCDQKKFECNHCDKKFSQKCYLNSHLKRVSGQTSVVCEICQKVCRDKGDYQIHFRSHSDVKPFKCSVCPKAYKTSSARAAHLETHMEKGFICTLCQTKLSSRRTLQKHVKTKHQKLIDVDKNYNDETIAVEIIEEHY